MTEFAVYALAHGRGVDLNVFAAGLRRVIPDGTRVRIWCNQVEDRSMFHGWDVFPSSENRPKYQAMRQMFASPIEEKYVLWLDDDTLFRPWKDDEENEHWPDLAELLRQAGDAAYVGMPCYFKHNPRYVKWCEKQPWWRGAARWFDERLQQHAIRFAHGGFFWLRTDLIKALDWPPAKFKWLGGSQQPLAEALWQLGHPLTPIGSNAGIFVQQSRRRTPQKIRWPWDERRGQEDITAQIASLPEDRFRALLIRWAAMELDRHPDLADEFGIDMIPD